MPKKICSAKIRVFCFSLSYLLIVLFLTSSIHSSLGFIFLLILSAYHSSIIWKTLLFLILLKCLNHLNLIYSSVSTILSYTFIMSQIYKFVIWTILITVIYRFLIFAFHDLLAILLQKYISEAQVICLVCPY